MVQRAADRFLHGGFPPSETRTLRPGSGRLLLHVLLLHVLLGQPLQLSDGIAHHAHSALDVGQAVAVLLSVQTSKRAKIVDQHT